MLHYATIDARTLELLKKLLQIPGFSGLRLAGGTSLALQIGHRKSIDLDLFGKLSIDSFTIAESINKLGNATLLKNTENITIYLINEIKVDIVNYPYAWLEEELRIDNLRLAGKKDIGAMKLAALTGRGSKKDFIDLYYLMQEYSLSTLLNLYNRKYPEGSTFLVLKSMSYFEDAELEQDPYMLHKTSWTSIKKVINETVENYLKNNYTK